MKLRLLAAFLCTGLMYCGGGSGGGGGVGNSGLDSSKTLGSLDEGEAMDLCEYFFGLLNPPRVIDCDGTEVTFGIDDEELADAVADCTADVSEADSCQATVGQAESCFEDQTELSDDEICELFLGGTEPELPASCAPIMDPTCAG